MLEKKSRRLLEYINNECGEGAYKIFEFADIKKDLHSSRYDADSIAEIVKYLAEHDYIKLKYIDEENMCVTNTPRGRVFHEESRSLRYEESYRKRTVALVFLSSFLGAFLGAIAAIIVMRFIYG